MTVAVVIHRGRPEAHELARQLVAWLEENGHDVRLPTDDARTIGVPEHGRDENILGDGAVLAVAVGGDGTMLRTVDLVAGAGVPVLGVNVGQLGYLTEVEPADAIKALERFFADEHQIEERMLLSVAATSVGHPAPAVPAFALNEAVLEKTPIGHTVRLAVSIDGDPWTTYNADGLIVATPTGSTAYSLSAGGPIVAPGLRALVLTPVSPHSLFDRALVFDPETRLRIEVASHRPATLSVDGRNLGVLEPGDAIVCTAADRSARLVTFSPRNFHQILRRKFGLGNS